MSTRKSGATMNSQFETEMVVIAGKPPRRVNLLKSAPLGWSPVFLLGIIALVDRADGSVLGAVSPLIKEEFGVSEFGIGILLSAPSLAAIALVALAGQLADKANRKLLLTAVIGTWAVLSFASAAAPTFFALLIARILLGMASPLGIPASASLVGDLYTTKVRSTAFTILRGLEYFGLPLGTVLGAKIAEQYGWRASFLVLGVPALLMALATFLLFREPRRGLADEMTRLASEIESETQNMTPDALENGETGQAEGPRISGPREISLVNEAASVLDRSSEPSIDITDSAPIFTFKGIGKQFKEVLSIRTLRLLIIAQMLLFIAFAGLFATAVTYFTRTTSLSLANAGAITGAIGGAGLVLGAFLGAAIGDALAKKKESYRITISALALGISVPCLFFFVLAPEVPVKIGFFFVINLCNIIALANLGAATADVLPASRRGSGFAVSQLLITLGSAFGAFFVQGIVSQIVVSVLGGETERSLRLGISIGVGSLLIPLLIGSLLLLKARSSYDQDAAAAIAESRASGSVIS